MDVENEFEVAEITRTVKPRYMVVEILGYFDDNDTAEQAADALQAAGRPTATVLPYLATIE
jgi:hypothetical protein